MRDSEHRVHLGGRRGMPWPSFATLDEAAQALAAFHAGQPPPRA
jgi:hypothetical protein